MEFPLRLPLIILLLLASPGLLAESRSLSFYHTHTGQTLEAVYYENGSYVDSALKTINRFLADFRSGEAHLIDPELLDLLYEIRTRTQSERPFEVISAFRSEATNEMLRSRSENTGVAQKSMHLLGRAIDIRLADVDLERLRSVALDLKRGGVGFYPGSNFVHVDTGRFRQW